MSELAEILARACGAPFGRRLGCRLATALVATINGVLFHFFFLFFPPHFFLRHDLLERPKIWGRYLSRPRWSFWGPLAAILDFAGGAVLQAVSECRTQMTTLSTSFTLSWQCQGKVKTRPGQGQGKYMARSRRGSGQVKERSRQGREARPMQDQCKVKAKQPSP